VIETTDGARAIEIYRERKPPSSLRISHAGDDGNEVIRIAARHRRPHGDHRRSAGGAFYDIRFPGTARNSAPTPFCAKLDPKERILAEIEGCWSDRDSSGA